MLLKTILTTALLATSATAMAQTYQQPTPYQQPNPYAHDEVYGRSEVQPRWMARRLMLARDVSLGERQSSFIRIDPRTRVSRIRLELTSGRTYVDSVFVTYTGGFQETVTVGQWISPRTPRLVIDLPAGRHVSGVAINSSTPTRAARGGGYRYMRPATVNVIGVRR